MLKLSQRKSNRLMNQKGLSLMEVLITITLIAIIGGTVGSSLIDSLEEGKRSSAEIQMKNFSNVLSQYRRHCNRFPTTDQGLEALISKPSSGKECKRYAPNGYMDGGELPLDPWDEEYTYESDGRKFTITSGGADQEIGGDDDITFTK